MNWKHLGGLNLDANHVVSEMKESARTPQFDVLKEFRQSKQSCS